MPHAYGWSPDTPDHRDQVFAAPAPTLAALPKKVDLRPHCPKTVYDQGQLGSCTGNAIACAIEFDLMKEGAKPAFTPSRLFIYYNERVMEHTIKSDAGAQIRDGVKSVNKLGAPPEGMWPYDPAKFEDKPSSDAYGAAAKYKLASYQRVARSMSQMKGCLAAGFPFVFGFTVYESFESPEVEKTGVVPMPGTNESMLGGHAVLAVGYDDDQQRFIVRNSWGPHWGSHGYFTMPYAYLLDSNLSDDFWTLRKVSLP